MIRWRGLAVGAVALGLSVMAGACAPDAPNDPGVPSTTTVVPGESLGIVTRFAGRVGVSGLFGVDPTGVTLIAEGATGPVVWSVERGRLPSWLELGSDGVFVRTDVDPSAGPATEPVEPFVQVRATDGADTTTGLVFFHSALAMPALLTDDEVPAEFEASLPDGTELVLRDRERSAAFGVGSIGAPYAVSDDVFAEYAASVLGSATSSGPVVHVDSAWPRAGEPVPTSPSGWIDYLDGRTGELIVTVEDHAMAGIVNNPTIRLMSPDRSMVLTATPTPAAPEGSINIVDVETASVRHVIPSEWFGEWTWSTDGQWIVVQNETVGAHSINLAPGAGFATVHLDLPDGICRPLSVTENDRLAVACAPDSFHNFLDQTAIYSVPLDGAAHEPVISLAGVAGQAKAPGSICTGEETARFWPFNAFDHAVTSPSGRYLVIQERCFSATDRAADEDGVTAGQIGTIDLVAGSSIEPLLSRTSGGGAGLRGDVSFEVGGLYWR